MRGEMEGGGNKPTMSRIEDSPKTCTEKGSRNMKEWPQSRNDQRLPSESGATRKMKSQSVGEKGRGVEISKVRKTRTYTRGTVMEKQKLLS